MSEAVVRRATVGDVAAVAPLFDAYRVFYGRPSDEALARRFIDERLTREEAVILLAERNGEPVGFTQLFPSFSSVSARALWILNDLFVAQSARRFGVASALMEAAEAFARDSGACRIVLETMPDNRPAQALYEARGWALDGTLHYQLSFD